MTTQPNIFNQAKEYGLEYDKAVTEYNKFKEYNVTLVKIIGTSLYTTLFSSKEFIQKRLFTIYQIVK